MRVTGLLVAESWGYIDESRTKKVLAKSDRLQAMLWKLRH